MSDTGTRKPVAVIILNWNGEAMMKKYLPSVVDNTPAGIADVIVADNGSTDGSVAMLGRDFPGVKVLELGENYGFAEGYNRAIAATGYEFTVLLNSDVRVDGDWLTPMYEYMRSHESTGAVQPVIRSDAEPSKFEYAGAAGGYLDRNGYPYCRGRMFDTIEDDMGQYATVADVDWASGAALMVRTDIYIKVGGMDRKFFAHMEEIDLCWRIRLAGYAVQALPFTAVYHLGGGTLPASNPRKTYLNFRNNLLLLHKNLPASVRKRRLFIRRLYDAAAWARMMVGGNWDDARAVLRAHRDYRRMAGEFDSCAPQQNLLTGRPDVIVDYFLRGKRTYKDLQGE